MNIGIWRTIPVQHWLFIAAVVTIPAVTVVNYIVGGVQPSVLQYTFEPMLAAGIAVVAFWLLGGARVRVRHSGEKAFLVAAIVCMWFVAYFLSGLVFTYVRNSLVVSIEQTMINLVVYGITAAALEYVRYGLLAATTRRHIIRFGAIISIVFALTQLPYGQINAANNIEEFIKIVVSSIIPATVTSFLLTYLALTCGLASVLVFRLTLVIIAVVPPIIPNYDWYLIGISSIILSVVTYLITDKQIQQQSTHRTKQLGRIRRATDVMYIALICALAAFMSGLFSYRPMAILSNSMQPVYSRGAMVVVERIDSPLDIKVGDIVQYQSAGKTITHRVVAIEAASDGSGDRVFRTKGDNSPSEDPVVAGSHIGGVVKAYIPYAGFPTIWLREAAR